MRLFTAIPFPQELKDLARDFFHGRLPVAYVNTDNLHITLNFIGEVEDSRLDQAKEVCRGAVDGRKGFPLEFMSVVKFHQQLHLTVAENPELSLLQRDLEAALGKAGFRFQERQYYPHVKLANLHMDKVMSKHRIENISRGELEKLSFHADRVALFSSKLLMHHAQHVVEEEYILANQ
ncbi:MAG: RNA 2',3'-cyclic phosphodiesterase [Candidatus Saccharibacteria bacterium]